LELCISKSGCLASYDMEQTLTSKFITAIEHFEKVASSSVNNNLMKWSGIYISESSCSNRCSTSYSTFLDILEREQLTLKFYIVKDYFLKSGLCLLAVGDSVTTARAFEKYRDLDPTFASTREHALLVDLSDAVEAGTSSQMLIQFSTTGNADSDLR